MNLSPSQISQLQDIAREAGKRIMPYFRSPHSARRKQDRSFVTDADMAAHDYIASALHDLMPHIPLISEEDVPPVFAEADKPFFLVDPLDGTRGFVEGYAEFTVNIALVEKRKPTFGIIYAPPQELLYAGGKIVLPFKREGSGKAQNIHVRRPAKDGLVVTRSRSHAGPETQAYLDSITVKDTRPSSGSLKFCWVAEGSADIYPRFGRTMEWDTAAGQAILEAAGGRLETMDHKPLTYGKNGFENPGFFARGML